ncbi:NB-ARC domain-containing protein [Micromonospora sp. NPDC005305]|uniref:NB-ARC domain-containing protein n=1 Tax=Micromonospora sp. NPDC005305 TaxID=3156875 RepID=UPI0033A0CB63
MVLADLLIKTLEPVVNKQIRKADFNRRFDKAVGRAVDRFRAQMSTMDPTIVSFLLQDAPVLDLPAVRDALRELVLQPARARDQAQEDFLAVVSRFAPTVPRDRLNKSITVLVRCLRDELQHLPELQPLFSLMYQQQQTELLAAMTSPAPSTGTSPSSRLPHRHYERFVGRSTELATIMDKMRPGDRTWVLVIDGIGGVGKTSLALEAAYRLTDQTASPLFDSVVWVSAKRDTLTAHGILSRASDFETLRDVFEVIGAVCGRPDISHMPEVQQRILVRDLLSGPRRVLLVLDNMETVDDEQLTSFLRELPQPAKAIVTSRHRIDVAFSIRLEGLSSSESAELIQTEAATRRVKLSDAEVTGLARRSGGVPLAIVWSLGLISIGHSTESVLRQLGSGTGDIAEFCFARSVEALGNGDARRLLAAASLFETPVDRNLLGRAAGLGEDLLGRDDALQMLIQLSLINHKAGLFDLLPLTRTYAREFLAKRPELRRTVEDNWFKALLPIAAGYGGPDLVWRDRAQLRIVGPHLETAYVMAREQGRTDAVADLAIALIAYFDTVGRWDDLLLVASELEDYGRAVSDAEAVADAVWHQNWVHGQRGELDLAWASLDRARGLAISPMNRINYLVGCSQTSRRAGRLDEARQYTDTAMAELPSIDNAMAGVFRGNIAFELGKIARDRGDWEEADRWFSEASKVFDVERAENAIADGERLTYDLERALGLLGNRAVVEHRRGNLAAAADMLERSLRLTRARGSLSNAATLLVRLASVRIDQGRLQEAYASATEAQSLATLMGMREELDLCRQLVGLLGEPDQAGR